MSELILIPCSGSKVEGSAPIQQERRATDDLNTEYTKKLKLLRNNIFNAFNLTSKVKIDEFMPAYRRYTGNIYSKIPKLAWENLKENKGLEIIIISAYYGIIYWDEPIICYNIAMSDNISPKRKLNTWWRKKGLTEIVAHFINNKEYDNVKSLLSISYQAALQGIHSKISTRWLQYEYPKLGSGSDYYRGVDIKNLLLDKNFHCPNCNFGKIRRISRIEFHCTFCDQNFQKK